MKPGWRPIIISDIKPGNFVLGKAHDDYCSAFEVAKMIDYGLAWNDGRLTKAAHKTRAVGTHGFNPPVSLSHA
jgi:serine/threonine protein kinase